MLVERVPFAEDVDCSRVLEALEEVEGVGGVGLHEGFGVGEGGCEIWIGDGGVRGEVCEGEFGDCHFGGEGVGYLLKVDGKCEWSGRPGWKV